MENNRSNYNKEARTFYWYFRPIAFLAMCVGVFPLQNTYYRNGTKLRFKKISFPHLINASIFYTTAYLLYYYSGFVFVKKNYEIGFIWRCIALYLMTARSAICYIYCTTHAKKFTRLIKLLEIFDMKKTSLLNINEYNGIRRFMIWTVCPIFYLFAILSVSFYELNKVAEGIFNNTMDNCEDVFVASKVFGTLGTWQTAPLFLYMYFTIIIKYNLLEIIKILKSNNIVSNFQMKDSKNDIYSISNTRHMYTIVTSSVKKVSDIFGTFLAIDQFCLIAMFVVNIYVFFFTNNRDIHLLIYTFLNALIIAIVINVSNKIKDLGQTILDLLERYPMTAFDGTSQIEIQIFLIQASTHPIEISAAGYFTMDRTQIPSILSSVATYIIVLVQLSPQLSHIGDPNWNVTVT